MGIPSATHQAASNAIAALGAYISLHTAAAGTTGLNETTGGSYVRQLASPWTPDGVGDNTAPQVNIPCAPGTYVEAGIYSTQSGSMLGIPSGTGVTPSTSGGTLAAGAKYYKVTAFNWQGETTGSTEVSATTTGTTSSCALTWSAVTGAAGYKIYRGTSSNAENVLVATVGAVTTYTDTGVAGTSATVPSVITASTFVGSSPFTGGSVTVSGVGASINVSPSIAA